MVAVLEYYYIVAVLEYYYIIMQLNFSATISIYAFLKYLAC